jgi:cell migration-inducing and hyaluronan-binding protein
MSGKDTLLPSDNTVTAYWITNPDNAFIDNVAAGSDEMVSGGRCRNTR